MTYQIRLDEIPYPDSAPFLGLTVGGESLLISPAGVEDFRTRLLALIEECGGSFLGCSSEQGTAPRIRR